VELWLGGQLLHLNVILLEYIFLNIQYFGLKVSYFGGGFMVKIESLSTRNFLCWKFETFFSHYFLTHVATVNEAIKQQK